MTLILELVVDFFISVVVDFFLVWTGDLLLFALTLGQRKPGFRFWKKDQPSPPVGFRNARALLGLLFWTGIWMWFRT